MLNEFKQLTDKTGIQYDKFTIVLLIVTILDLYSAACGLFCASTQWRIYSGA